MMPTNQPEAARQPRCQRPADAAVVRRHEAFVADVGEAREERVELSLRVRLRPRALHPVGEQLRRGLVRPAAKNAVTKPHAECDPRAPRDEHDPRLSARSQNATDLRERALRVWRVVDHAPRVDEVELVVREGKALGSATRRSASRPFERQTLAHGLDGRLGQIDTGRVRPGPHELDEVRAEADADLEDASCRASARTPRSPG